MTAIGVVREWHTIEGWGVIDSAETPGGCWAHFSHGAIEGYVELTKGEAVYLDWEEPGQDGFPFRAVSFWRVGTARHVRESENDNAYQSTLTLSFDPPE